MKQVGQTITEIPGQIISEIVGQIISGKVGQIRAKYSLRKLRVRLEQIDMLHDSERFHSTVDIQSRIQDLKFEEKRLLTILLGQHLEVKQTLTERLQLLDALEVIGDLLMWIAAGVLVYYVVRWW